MKKITSVLLLSFVLSGLLSAQPIILTPEYLWKLGRVGLEDISPDKSSVLYGVTRYDVELNKSSRDLYTQNIGSEVSELITTETGSEYNARFNKDGGKVYYLKGDKLFELTLSTKEARQVSEEQMTGFQLSKDNSMILFTRDVKFKKTTQEIYSNLPKNTARIYDDLMYKHWDHFEDENFSNVFYAKFSNGGLEGTPVNIMNEPFDSPLSPMGDIGQITWSPDGKFIAYTCKKKSGKEFAQSTNSDIYLYNVLSKKTDNISYPNAGYDTNPTFSPDGIFIAWNSMQRDGFESDKNRVFFIRIGDKVNVTDATKSIEFEADAPRWSADGKRIYFTIEKQATVQLAYYDILRKEVSQLTGSDQNYGSFVLGKDLIVAEKTSLSSPLELVVVDMDGREANFTTVNKADWERVSKGDVKKRMVTTSDKKKMLVYVVYPPGFSPTKKYPTLLYCQGGPQSAVNQFFSYRWNLQLLAAQGYIVVAPNRRGLPSFGRAWNDDISGDYGGQAMTDLLSAIDDISKEPYVDKAKLGALGASFGGYSVYWLAGNHNKRFKSFVAHAGMFNFTSWYGTTEEVFFGNWDLKGPYWDKSNKSYSKFSPHQFVNKWDTPILITHGELDYRVPVTEGMQAFQAAQLKNVPSRMVLFPDENHWIKSPQNTILFHHEIINWLNKYLK